MQRPLRLSIYLSVAAAACTIAMKVSAYVLTDSVGLLSDALESGVNLFTALAAWFSLWYAALPVDADHTYGHEKIEFFSSGLEGALILVAAAGIAWVAVDRLQTPKEVERLDLGALISLSAAAVNLVVGLVLIRTGRTHRSIALEANGRHLMTDVWTSVGVIAGLVLARLTGWFVLDPLLGLLMAANICWTAYDLIRRSFDGLMDHALPVAEQQKVREAIASRLGPGMHYHALRTRQAGSRRFVDFHFLVPGRWTVREAHGQADLIEEAIRAALPGVEVTIHIEPIEQEASWKDSDLLAVEEKAHEQP
jgi:cation diffusion facilitator family transporter